MFALLRLRAMRVETLRAGFWLHDPYLRAGHSLCYSLRYCTAAFNFLHIILFKYFLHIKLLSQQFGKSIVLVCL